MPIKPIDALNRLREIGLSFGISQSFFAACNMGIFDLLDKGPATAEELGKKLNVNPEGCRRLLVVLHRLDLVNRDTDHYSNTELGAFLTSASPSFLNGLAKIGRMIHMWEYLPEALRTYGPVWQQALGTTSQEVFAGLYANPTELRRVTDYMNAYSVAIGQEIAERYDFTPHKCLLDVAGGPGGLSRQIGLKYPHLHGIVMDMPQVLEISREQIAADRLSDRFRTEVADLFDGPYPSGADVITLSWILHDWNDDNCRKVLGHCFAALPSGGVLLISESVMNEDFSGTSLWPELYSLFMLVVCETAAKERTESEHRELLEQVGFRDMKLIRFDAPRDLIVARKA